MTHDRDRDWDEQDEAVVCHEGVPVSEVADLVEAVGNAVKGVLKGDTGEKGEQGPIGPAGAQGEAGAVGETGPAGADGATGPQGEVGAAGPAGADGAAGANGADGAVGPAGADGKNFDETRIAALEARVTALETPVVVTS